MLGGRGRRRLSFCVVCVGVRWQMQEESVKLGTRFGERTYLGRSSAHTLPPPPTPGPCHRSRARG